MGLISDLFRSRRFGGDSPMEAARRDLAMFREASFVRSDVALPTPTDIYRRYGMLMYFLGAARYSAVQHGLDESGFVLVASDYLREIGFTRAEVESAISDLAYSRFKPRGREAFNEGTQTIELWQMGHDNDAPMRLAELLRQWQ